MKHVAIVVLVFLLLNLTACYDDQAQQFFSEYPKSDKPILVSGRKVYLPLYDEFVEQLNLFGFGGCDLIRPHVKIEGTLIPFTGIDDACLLIFSISKVWSSDVGQYDELSFIIPLIRKGEQGQPRVSTYMHSMYLNPQAQFAIELGKKIWGYPKEAAKMLKFHNKGALKTVNLETEKGDVLEMKWKVRGEVDNSTKKEFIDLVTPTGGVAPTVLRIFETRDQVLFDPKQDEFSVSGELKALSQKMGFTPVYWQNILSNAVSGIEQ